MKVLTKELKNDLELFEILYALNPKEKNTMPVVFLGDCPKGVVQSDIKTVESTSFLFVTNTLNYFGSNLKESEFLSRYANRLRIISNLPKEILKQIKDKRLLALGYAEQNVKDAIEDYAGERVRVAFSTLKESLEDSIYDTAGLSIERQFALHPQIYSVEALFDEARIICVTKKGNDLYIKLNKNETIVLTDAEALEEEIKPDNTYVRLFELHKIEHNYELHFLLMTSDSDLIEHFHYVTYRFKDMCFCKTN